MRALRELYPEHARMRDVSDDRRIIVSEPLGDLAGAWNKVPESSHALVREGEEELRTFRPR